MGKINLEKQTVDNEPMIPHNFESQRYYARIFISILDSWGKWRIKSCYKNKYIYIYTNGKLGVADFNNIKVAVFPNMEIEIIKLCWRDRIWMSQ